MYSTVVIIAALLIWFYTGQEHVKYALFALFSFRVVRFGLEFARHRRQWANLVHR
jgi:hypothetical protein